MYSPLWKITHPNPSVLCTPPFEKSPIKSHGFCVVPPLKNHPSKPIGFVYSPLCKITHQNPSVLCTPPLKKSLFFDGRLFRDGRLFWQIRYWPLWYYQLFPYPDPFSYSSQIYKQIKEASALSQTLTRTCGDYFLRWQTAGNRIVMTPYGKICAQY